MLIHNFWQCLTTQVVVQGHSGRGCMVVEFGRIDILVRILFVQNRVGTHIVTFLYILENGKPQSTQSVSLGSCPFLSHSYLLFPIGLA
jgi:hypothetical protein